MNEPRSSRGFGKRILHWVGQAVLWMLAVGPGLLVIGYGLDGIRNERLVTVGRFGRYEHVWHGADAVGWGWFMVGVGFWALGYFCYLKTGRMLLNILGWVFAVIAVTIGAGVLFS